MKERSCIRFLSLLLALAALTLGTPSWAEVGGRVIAAPGDNGIAYDGSSLLADVAVDISIDNSLGGQVPVTLSWCDPVSRKGGLLTVAPGRSEGKAIFLGLVAPLPPPGGGFPCAAAPNHSVFWNCESPPTLRPAVCKFNFKVERHCNCGVPSPIVPSATATSRETIAVPPPPALPPPTPKQ